MKKAVVLGAGGFIGSHLSEKLCKEGHEIVGIDWMKSSVERKLINKKILLKYDNFTFIQGDIRLDLPQEKFDVIYHLAALSRIQPSFLNPIGGQQRQLFNP